MKTLFLLFTALSLCLISWSQKIAISVKGENDSLIRGASVVLKRADNSKVESIGITDSTGKCVLKFTAENKYFITLSHVGYANLQTAPFPAVLKDTVYQLEYRLTRNSTQLKAAEVLARKPLVELKAGKIILNVENSILAVGQSAFELLQKAPGVTADKDDNFSLMGMSGVSIYIDGRPSPLGGKDLAALLRNIQSSQIESIEIIKNPSAKYDAAGSAGIINIRLKKNQLYGTNGSVYLGANMGDHLKYNGGIALNHRSSRLNIYGNYNHLHGRYEGHASSLRTVADSIFRTTNSANTYSDANGLTAGMDYTINKKNSFGALFNGLLFKTEQDLKGHTDIVSIPTGKTNRNLVSDGNNISRRKTGTINLNYRYTDTTGRSLSVDADYGIYRYKTDQAQPNAYYDPAADTLLYANLYNLHSPSDIDIYSFKADYEQNLHKGRLNLGGKTSYVTSDNDFQQNSVIAGIDAFDSLHSNRFRYTVNINALYVDYYRDFKGFSTQLGCRMENTIITGHSNGYQLKDIFFGTYDSSFRTHYTNFFPSAAFTYNKNPKRQLTINYAYRIDRPSYRDLNPFDYRIDDYSSRRGNTALRPQFTNSLGVTFLYHQKWITTVNYSHIDHVMAAITDTENIVKSVVTKANLATQDLVSLSSNFNSTFKWYSIYANFTGWHSSYRGDLGPGRTVDLNIFACTGNLRQSFALGKGWSGELSGFYNSPSILQGTYKTRSIWAVDAGVRKSILKGRGTVALSGSDLFNTIQNRTTVVFAGQQTIGSSKDETRMVKLNIYYRFGNMKVKDARQHKAGLEEEGKRAN